MSAPRADPQALRVATDAPGSNSGQVKVRLAGVRLARLELGPGKGPVGRGAPRLPPQILEGGVRVQALLQGLLPVQALGAHAAVPGPEPFHDIGWQIKGFVGGQAQAGLGFGDFLRREGRAVGVAVVLHGAGALGDGGVADDQGGHAGVGLGLGQGGADLAVVVAVDLDDPPAQALEDLFMVRAVAAAGGTGQLHLVVVVAHDKARQLEMSGQGGRAQAHRGLDVAVRGQDIGVVVGDVRPEPGPQHGLGHGHAHGHGETLSQGAGGGLDSRGQEIFGMPWGFAAELPEAGDVLHGQDALEKKQGIEQHGLVPGREHEAVPVEPGGVVRVDVEKFREQDVAEIGRGHGPAGMAGIGLANGVHDQALDDIDRLEVEVGGGRHDGGPCATGWEKGSRAYATQKTAFGEKPF